MRLSLLLGLFLTITCLSAQGQSVQNATTTVDLLKAAALALAPDTTLQDARLAGTATLASGDTVNALLEAQGPNASRLEIAGLMSKEVRNDNAGDGAGIWVDRDGNSHPLAGHNCWIPAGWFLPQMLVAQGLLPDVVSGYVAREVRNGAAVDHVRYLRNVAGYKGAGATLVSRLTTVDLYLDGNSHLLRAARFFIHADNDAEIDIPVELRFSDYRPVNGVNLPYQIDRYVQGNLQFSIVVTLAAVNTGIPASEFALQ